jgi:hypothetical protein
VQSGRRRAPLQRAAVPQACAFARSHAGNNQPA